MKRDKLIKMMPTSSIETSPNKICRICHQQSPQKGLIGPCRCQGSIGRVHKNCMEKWLTISHRSNCELCGTSFVCHAEPPSIKEYLQTSPRSLMTFAFVFSIATSTVIMLTFVCVHGIFIHSKWQKVTESTFLMIFLVVLFICYFWWIIRALIENYRHYREWSRSNPNLKITFCPGSTSLRRTPNSTSSSPVVTAATYHHRMSPTAPNSTQLSIDDDDDDDENDDRLNTNLIISLAGNNSSRQSRMRSTSLFCSNA